MTRSEEQALTDALLHLDYIERYGAMGLGESVVIDAMRRLIETRLHH